MFRIWHACKYNRSAVHDSVCVASSGHQTWWRALQQLHSPLADSVFYRDVQEHHYERRNAWAGVERRRKRQNYAYAAAHIRIGARHDPC